ncbi:SDR family oxidoreductase [Streptomyces coeruleorubidus]
MKRVAQTIRLRPEHRDLYLRLHSAVWPGVEGALRAANIRNRSIFLREDTLFGRFEYHGDDFEADMAAADHVREGIRVNCVTPGTVDTPWVARLLGAADDPEAERAALDARQPLGRLVTADEVAAAVVHLASPAAASVTGIALAVDGGMQGPRLRPAVGA